MTKNIPFIVRFYYVNKYKDDYAYEKTEGYRVFYDRAEAYEFYRHIVSTTEELLKEKHFYYIPYDLINLMRGGSVLAKWIRRK